MKASLTTKLSDRLNNDMETKNTSSGSEPADAGSLERVVSLPARVVWDAIGELRELQHMRRWWKASEDPDLMERYDELTATICKLVDKAWQAND